MKSFYWISISLVVTLIAFGTWHVERDVAPTVSPDSQTTQAAFTPSAADPCVADGTIKTKAGPWGKSLYLICFQMNSSTILFNNPDTLNGFGADGQVEAGAFTVVVRPSAFPIPAPASCKGIIVGMPWTFLSNSADVKMSVAAKQALYDQLLALKSNPSGHVNVALQLTPYVSVVQTKPLKVRLTECNVFFRNVSGKYVASLN